MWYCVVLAEDPCADPGVSQTCCRMATQELSASAQRDMSAPGGQIQHPGDFVSAETGRTGAVMGEGDGRAEWRQGGGVWGGPGGRCDCPQQCRPNPNPYSWSEQHYKGYSDVHPQNHGCSSMALAMGEISPYPKLLSSWPLPWARNSASS